MKSLTTIFAFLFATVTFGQTFAPIQAYRENDYTPREVKNFALQSTELSSNFRRELVMLANAGLVSSGEKVTLTESHIAWILDHTRDSFVVLQSFVNSHRKVGGSEITFFNDKNFSGNVGIFSFGKCRVILYKSRCMNLLEIPAEKIPTPTPKQVAPPVEVADTIRKKKVIVIEEEEVVHVRRKSGYTIQGAYQTQGAYRIGCDPGPRFIDYGPQPQRYYSPPRPHCEPRSQPMRKNTYYGSRRTGR